MQRRLDFLSRSTWPGRYIKSRTSDEVKLATGYQAAVDTWIDTFGETARFQYDDEGFPEMHDYSLL